MIRVLRAVALAAILSTLVFAQPRGKWVLIDDTADPAKRTPLTACPSLESQTSKPPVITEKVDTEVTPIGTIQNFNVYDVIHSFTGDYGKGWVKRIFIEKAPKQFCEIYRTEGLDVTHYAPGGTFIISSDGGQILGTRCDLTGSAHLRSEAFWVFDEGGPVELKPYDILEDVIKELLPKDRLIQKAYGLDLQRLCYLVPIWKPEDPACCGSAGSFFVKFALKGGSLVVTRKEYNPMEDSIEKHIKECPIN